MKTNVICCALFLSWSIGASAQETAISVAPLGLAVFDRPSEARPSGGGRYSGIQLPDTISVGDVIPLQYPRDGGMVSDSFMVTGILIEAGKCTLESKNSTVVGASPERIFMPCRLLR